MQDKEREIFTLPNILTLYRLFLAPILYLSLVEGMHGLALFVFLLSGASDIADGFIARHLGEVSDLGKILDPIADKLTYFLALLGLIPEAPLLTLLLVALAVKEGVSLVSSLIAIRHSASIAGARIHGKIAGILLWSTVLLHLIFPSLPSLYTILSLSLTLTAMTVSFVLYLKEHLSTLPRGGRNIVEDFMRRL